MPAPGHAVLRAVRGVRLVQNLRAMQVIVHRQEKRLVLGDLAQRALCELVQLLGSRQLHEERREPPLLGHLRHPQEDRPRFYVLRNCFQRLEILEPFAEHHWFNAGGPPLGAGSRRSRASASSSSWTSLSTEISRPRAVTRAGKPVSRAVTAFTRAASSGSADGRRLRFVAAPDQRASRSAARTERPLRTILRASRRRPSLSGTASTALAWPSVRSPRSTSARMSSGSSSSRSRFETAGFEPPTRSAISPRESSNSSARIA